MRLVLDTNVVVSGLVWGGGPYRLLQAASAGEIVLYTSPALLDELHDVLARAHLASRLAQQRSTVEAALRFYAELAHKVSPLSTPRVVPSDADDDHVIAAALAAQADLLVTGDSDLLSIGQHKSLSICTVSHALSRLKTSG